MQQSLKLSSIPWFQFLTGLFIIILISGCFKYYWSRRKLYLFSRQLPGPKALPFVGNGLQFLCKKEDILDRILQLTIPYPSPMRLWLGPRLFTIIHDPHQLQVILQSNKISTKSYIYRFLEPFLGKGLFTSAGIVHKIHRKLLQPLFAQKMVEAYSLLFEKHANKFIKKVEPYLNGDEFDVLIPLHDSAFEATMDILLEDKNDHTIDYKDVPHYIRRFYNLFFMRVTSFWLHPDFVYKRTSFFKEQQHMTEMAKIMTQELMDKTVVEVVDKVQNPQKFTVADRLRAPSMLEMLIDMLVKNPNCLTESECIDHMMTFVATSQDTQSSAIAFTFMMLALHPHIQNAVLLELKDVLGDKKSVDLNDTNNLKYLEMCIKESMRLFPVAPFILRDTHEDFSMNEWIIPKDVTVVLGIYNVHRNAKYWEHPDEFYPEHFTPEAISKRHPYAFLPFSAGPRKCIAQQYSFVNMKIVIGNFLLNYILESNQSSLEDIKLMTDVSIRPVNGYLIKIRPR